MFEIPIIFKASEAYIKKNQDIYPIPAKLNIPKWFKKLEHSVEATSVKGCIPFLDSLTAGYILKIPSDYLIEHNTIADGKKITGFSTPLYREEIGKNFNLNYHGEKQMHPEYQVQGSPMLKKNMDQPIHKILNPWIIETPPGYSCLFLPPMNNSDDRFSIIPAIVDTDKFKMEVNFPIIINGDKYKSLKTTIERGTPYVQIIPFKRQSWKMKIKPSDVKERELDGFFYRKHIINTYKKIIWSKKIWK